jgi:hypothetical protein
MPGGGLLAGGLAHVVNSLVWLQNKGIARPQFR